MLELAKVTDEPHLFGEQRLLLNDVSLDLPRGRYALLSATPELHKALIDVMAGLRPPNRGVVRHDGLVSWPMGRSGFARGKLTGLQMTWFICSVYGVQLTPCIDFLTGLMTAPEFLRRKFEDWPRYVLKEYVFSISLVPEFDIFFVDSMMPIDESRFSKLWQSLFEEQLAGRSLIFSCARENQLMDFCTKGLIYEDGRLWIEDDLEQCIQRYPLQESRAEESGDPDDEPPADSDSEERADERDNIFI
jgi:capsular polysaccharide transport system ATP-binding protein